MHPFPLQSVFPFKPVFAPLASTTAGGTGFPAFLGLSFYWAPECSLCSPGMYHAPHTVACAFVSWFRIPCSMFEFMFFGNHNHTICIWMIVVALQARMG